MSAPFGSVVGSEEELRQLYRQPSELVKRKKVTRIDDTTRAFVEASPFCLLATADADGRCDVSPRGGPPGFVKVLDEGVSPSLTCPGTTCSHLARAGLPARPRRRAATT